MKSWYPENLWGFLHLQCLYLRPYQALTSPHPSPTVLYMKTRFYVSQPGLELAVAEDEPYLHDLSAGIRGVPHHIWL